LQLRASTAGIWLCVGVMMVSVRAEALDYAIAPTALQEQIAERGVDAVHHELFSHPMALNMFLLALDSGEDAWLDLAETFLTLSHPLSEPRIRMAVGEALQWAPAQVLQRPAFDLTRICGLEGMYDWRLFSRFLAEVALQRRVARVTVVSESALAERRRDCLKSLRKAQAEVDRSFSNRVPE